jgi:hypothetical protein
MLSFKVSSLPALFNMNKPSYLFTQFSFVIPGG